MDLQFDIKLNSDDMYRFNMYHAYTSFQGWGSLLLGLLVVGIIAFSGDFHDLATAGPYLLIAAIFLLYVPISLKTRSKRQILTSDVLKNVLHFSFGDDGITVTSDANDEEALLPWDCIYKVVQTKHNLLIYSNRVNAYIIPLSQVADRLPQILDCIKNNCEAYRLHIKG